MLDAKLASYIKQAREKGLKDKDIKDKLSEAGWAADQIKQVFEPQDELVPPPPPPKSTTHSVSSLAGSLSMWDTFEHILMFISLFVFSTVFALTIHLFIDHWFPNVLENLGYFGSSLRTQTFQSGLLRGYLATIIVSYPIFAYLFINVSSRTLANPNIRSLQSRKALIYLTLIVTFLIMIYKFISIVFSFLNGNVTFNFILHFIVTMGITGLIFWYYLKQVQEDRQAAYNQ